MISRRNKGKSKSSTKYKYMFLFSKWEVVSIKSSWCLYSFGYTKRNDVTHLFLKLMPPIYWKLHPLQLFILMMKSFRCLPKNVQKNYIDFQSSFRESMNKTNHFLVNHNTEHNTSKGVERKWDVQGRIIGW